MPNHAFVGSFRSSGIAHGIGKQLAALADGMAAHLAPINQSLHIAFIDAALDKDGFHLRFHKKIDEPPDMPDACLRLGADALNAAHINSIGATKISKGV